MKRHEAVAAVVSALSMITAGLVWRFGFYGLVGPGVAVLLAMFFVDVRE